MSRMIEFTNAVEVRAEYDVVVIGGGAAGITAAVSAARGGAKTAIIEQTAMLGGLGTSGMMTAIIAPTRYFGGLGTEIVAELRARGGVGAESVNEEQIWVPYQNEVMKRLYDDLVVDSGVDVLFYTKVIGVHREHRRIDSVILSGVEGNFAIGAKVFVDASGDGILSVFAGEQYELGDENGNTQAPTMTAYYANVDFARFHAFGDREGGDFVKIIHRLIPKAVEDGVVSMLDLHHPGAIQVSPNMAVANCGHIYGADCCSSEGLTKATIHGRKMAEEYYQFYRKYIPGFENAYMTNTAGWMGIRETRRIVGRYQTSYEDKKAYRHFADAVMRFDGGIGADLHASSNDIKGCKAYFDLFIGRDPKEIRSGYSTMPYRSFLARNSDNLLIAGRCASLDRVVNASLRVMGYCMMMGQIAGTAAAQSIKEEKLACDIDVSRLQKTLTAAGVANV